MKVPAPPLPAPAIFTIGHATRSLDDFLELLRHYGIARLVDVRTVPRSRHNPQFNRETFSVFLRLRGINYRHLPELGGLRHPHADSPNGGWHNTSFRGFADYMQTPAFAAAIEKLLTLASHRTTAIMCAETVPWRCHRSLIGDALLVRGVAVTDITSLTHSQPHALNPMARVVGTSITYPAADGGDD